MTTIEIATMAARIHHRRSPTATNTVKIMLRQRSHRHGNCMNFSLGRISQKTAVTENIRKLQAAAQPKRLVHTLRFVSRHAYQVPIADANATTISNKATQEIILLNAS